MPYSNSYSVIDLRQIKNCICKIIASVKHYLKKKPGGDVKSLKTFNVRTTKQIILHESQIDALYIITFRFVY